MIEWFRTLVDSPQEPGIWIAASLSMAIIASNLAWLFTRYVRSASPGSLPMTPALTWLLVSAFLLSFPFLGLRAGALSPRAMGLASLDWLHDLGLGGLLAAIIAVLALWGWSRYQQQSPEPAWATSARWLAPANAMLKQWHWAFYRAAGAGLLVALAANPLTLPPVPLGASGLDGPVLSRLQIAPLMLDAVQTLARQDSATLLYWGNWLGLALAGVEATLNPFTRAAMQEPGRAEAVVLDIVVAIATTALFVVVRNFWLCAACHMLVETAIKWPRVTLNAPATN